MRESAFPSSKGLELATEKHPEKARLAIEAYKQAIRIRPDYGDAYEGLGSAYLFLQRYEEAIGAYRSAIKNDPKNPLMRIGLGYVYLAIGDIEGALEEHKAALKLIDVSEPRLMGTYEMGAMMLFLRINERVKKSGT